jgi:hypothetical protein
VVQKGAAWLSLGWGGGGPRKADQCVSLGQTHRIHEQGVKDTEVTVLNPSDLLGKEKTCFCTKKIWPCNLLISRDKTCAPMRIRGAQLTME